MGKFAVAVWGGALTLGWAASAWAGPTAQGAPFRFSSCTSCIQQSPAVAGSASGAFLGVWEGTSATDSQGVSGRFFTSAGAPQAADFLASRNLAADQYDAAVARDTQGNFIVVWSEVAAGNSEIVAQRYRANGTRLGATFKVNQDPTGTPTIPADFKPAVAGTNDGGFIVAWMNLLPPGPGFSGTTPQVLARKISSAGAPIGTQVTISTGLVNGDRPDVCVDTAGRPVVVWTSVDGFPLFESNHKGVSLRRLTPAGAPTGAAETVVAPPVATSARPAVACGNGSTFMVVWHTDQPPATDRSDILAQRFTRMGRPAGKVFRVNGTTTGNQSNPSVASDPQGNFVVVWQAYVSSQLVGIYGRRFAASGSALSPDFPVVSGPDDATAASNADVATVGTAGNFVVVWQSGAQGISGRRFTP
jgi:hypothetical protein